MRKSGLLVFVLLLGISLIPGIIGFQIERQFKALVFDASKTLNIRLLDYQRGWFSSSAVTLVYGGLDATQVPIKLRVEHVIEHGPLFDDELVLLARVTSSFTQNGLSLLKQQPAVLLSRVDLSTIATAKLDWQGVSLSHEGVASQLEIPRLQGDFKFDPLHKKAKLSVVIPKLMLSHSDGFSLEVKNVRFQGSQEKGRLNQRLGDVQLSWESLSYIHEARQETWSMIGFSLMNELGLSQGLLEYRLSLRLDALNVNQQSLSEMDLLLSVQKLSPNALSLLQQRLNNLPSGLSMDAYRPLLWPILAEALQGVIANDPQISLDHLQFVTPYGETRANFSIKTEGLKRLDLISAPRLINYLVADLFLTLPENLLYFAVELLTEREWLSARQQHAFLRQLTADEFEQQVQLQAATKVQSLIERRFFLRKAQQLRLEAQFTKGLLTLNEHLFPLSDF